MKTQTFLQWLNTSKSNRNGLVLQMIFALIFYIGLAFDDTISTSWAIFVVVFTTIWAILAWLRVYLIWSKVIKNKKAE